MLRSEDKQVTAKTRRMVNSRLSNRVCYHWLRCCCRRGCGGRRQLQCLCSGLSERGGQLHLGGVLELQLGIGQWNGIYGLRNGMQCVMEQNGWNKRTTEHAERCGKMRVSSVMPRSYGRSTSMTGATQAVACKWLKQTHSNNEQPQTNADSSA